MNKHKAKKQKKCKIINYTKHLLILSSAVTGYVSISDFASFVGISVGNASSAATIEICVVAGIKRYKSIIRKKEDKYHRSFNFSSFNRFKY